MSSAELDTGRGPGSTAAIVPAAGSGSRLGPGAPKALRDLGGVPMLVHAVRALVAARHVRLVVVAAPPERVAEVRALLAAHEDLSAVAGTRIDVIAGGATRQESVRLALASLPDDVDMVLVHDAARPLVPAEVVAAVAAAVRGGGDAVIPVLPLVDTVKQVGADGVVTGTLDRAALRAVQTPQGFRRRVLEQAHLAGACDPADDATDDAVLCERVGAEVRTVPGAAEGFKVTRPLDLLLAEALLARRRAGDVR